MDDKEELIEKMIENLDISYKEALELVEYDKQVDKTPDNKQALEYDLTKEQQKAIKSYKNTAKGATGKQTNRKANNDKLYIMEVLENALKAEGVEIEIENKERIIMLEYNGNKYSVTLAQKRK